MKKAAMSPCPGDDATMDDLLLAVSVRLKPVKLLAVDLLNAAISAVASLWPGEETPESLGDMVSKLKETEDRLDEWRESAGRAGADIALQFVLSWYEGINLEVLQTMRTNGKYSTDPDLIKKRKEMAYSFINYADLHLFCEPLEEETGADGDADTEASDAEEPTVAAASTSDTPAADTAEASGSRTT